MQSRHLTLDLTPDNLSGLSTIIRSCITSNIELQVYSSSTMKHPNTPMTQIPGLKNLFVEACLSHGLLGYLDWMNEHHPSDYTKIARDNIIIITCSASTEKESTDIIHNINMSHLEYIRNKSRCEFNELISDLKL